jgi:hypothetical protein
MLRIGKAIAVLVLSCSVVDVGSANTASPLGTHLGPAQMGMIHTYAAYYDGHKDTYVITDVSSKSQAAALHINYSAAIGTVKGAPFQYFVQGKAAAGQPSVFGSEPGESDYNPLWEEKFVTWKPGVKPVLLTSDNQINSLAQKGELTETDAHVVLNAPIIRVAK